MRETVTMPVAIEVMKLTKRARSINCCLFKSFKSIPLEVGRGHNPNATRNYLYINAIFRIHNYIERPRLLTGSTSLETRLHPIVQGGQVGNAFALKSISASYLHNCCVYHIHSATLKTQKI